MAKTIPLGTLARRSIPDAIVFRFMLPGQPDQPRDLTDYDARITLVRPEDEEPIHGRVGEVLDQGDEATKGKVRYAFQDGDLDQTDAQNKGTKLQCVITKPGARHFSDIAVLNITDSPASDDPGPE